MENTIGFITVDSFESDVRLYKEASYLISLGYSCEIISLDRKGQYQCDSDSYRGLKIKRYNPHTKLTDRLSRFKLLKMLIYVYWYFKYILFVKRYVADTNDYLHCMGMFETIIGVAANTKKQKKVIFDMRELYSGTTSNKVFNWISHKILKFIIKKSSYIIYLNDTQLKYKKNEATNWIYLPNYPDVTHFNDIQKIEYNKLRINYAGTVRDYASLSMLITIIKDDPEIEVHIYGAGGILDDLKKASNDIENVYIHGPYDGVRDSENIYKNTDIVYSVYNPDKENWCTALPVKLFESLCTETPMIAVEDTIFGNFVKENDIGFVFNYGEEGLRKLIKEVKNPNVLKNKKENIKKIKNRYTWNQIVMNLDEIYKGKS